MLISLSKSFLEFILESPTFLGGSRNHCEAIQPGKTRIFDDRYTVFVWELVSYRPVFLHFSFEACIFFHISISNVFWFLGWYFLYHDHCAVYCSYKLHNPLSPNIWFSQSPWFSVKGCAFFNGNIPDLRNYAGGRISQQIIFLVIIVIIFQCQTHNLNLKTSKKHR